MNNPIVQIVIYGLRRHWVVAVFFLFGVGAVLGTSQFKTDQDEKLKKAGSDLLTAQGAFVTDVPMTIKPVPENLEQADKNLARIEQFFDTAAGVFRFDVNATYEGNFFRHLNVKINELNVLAASNRVIVPNTAAGAGQTNRKYHFTFSHFQDTTRLPADQIEGLALALHDVQSISKLFLESGIVELSGIQRVSMVATEDSNSGGDSGDAAQAIASDLKHYTNSEETLEGYPYRITFVCYPEVLGAVLGRVASFPASGTGIFLTRSMSVESVAPSVGQVNNPMASLPSPDPLDGGEEDDEGGGGAFGGGVAPGSGDVLPIESVAALTASNLGSTEASTAVGERLLRVVLRLDVVRSLINHADGREEVADGEGVSGFGGDDDGF